MRKKSTWAWLAAILTLATAACSSTSPSGGKASSSPSDNGTLKPTGNTATPSTTATSASAASTTGLRTFPFPAGMRPEFQTPLPASGTQRNAVIGYENFVDSMWYAVYTNGTDTTYKSYMGGNALTYEQGMIKDASTSHQNLNGKIIYYDISVPQVFSSDIAVVQACVDTSGLYYVDRKTGKDIETFFLSSAYHYQEQVSIGRKRNGIWFVSHIADNSPSAGGSAGVCA